MKCYLSVVFSCADNVLYPITYPKYCHLPLIKKLGSSFRNQNLNFNLFSFKNIIKTLITPFST